MSSATTTAAPAAYAQAVQQARTIAEIARDRYADGVIRSALLTIAAHLDMAAVHLADDALMEATEALISAEQVIVEHPMTRFPALLGEYVLAPLEGRPFPMPHPLRTSRPEDAMRDTDVRNRLAQLHADPTGPTERPEQWLRAVLNTWQKHLRLVDSVRAMNARPCNQG
ncbi:hypothetical protein ACIBAC_00675 [Streptomyces sp. NPDC051362]|uniref:hypothetical protein n=1 Tax=Streptomyces sp. NPDC051362 TaxID=3365651 RepID=UPI0037AB4028